MHIAHPLLNPYIDGWADWSQVVARIECRNNAAHYNWSIIHHTMPSVTGTINHC